MAYAKAKKKLYIFLNLLQTNNNIYNIEQPNVLVNQKIIIPLFSRRSLEGGSMCRVLSNNFKSECKFKHLSFWFIVSVCILMVFPFIGPSQNLLAAIDETMPSTIPQEVIDDWMDQDGVSGSDYSTAITSIVGKLPTEYAAKYEEAKKSVSGDKNIYLLACHYRRVSKMKKHEADIERILFAKHHNFGGFLVGYHENISSNTLGMQTLDDNWQNGGALCVLNMKNYYSKQEYLLKKTDGVPRDPCVSFDGKKIVFAISGAKGKGYKIYEMEVDNPSKLKQLTSDPATDVIVADYEPCYLPNGDIVFSSTRCFGMVDCAWNPVSNLFVMNGEGKYLRRVGYDQVHTFYPVLMDNGKVLYTRWEYNDRILTSCMGLFYMNPDGTHQTEFYGNQTTWPMTMIHARPIPNSDKVMAVAGGHHAPYSGELMIIDPVKYSDGTAGIQMIAPKRATKSTVKKDDISAGDVQFLFQNPLPLNENDFLVSWRKTEDVKLYKLYYMDVDGNRELLAWDDQSVSQPVLLKPRTKLPANPASTVDYTKDSAVFTMQDVYIGAGLKTRTGTVAKGTAKRLRVVKIDYRAQGATIGQTGGSSGFVSCPVSKFGASWESKTVLGETPIYSDGSASFVVPARTPVYFQVLDSMGYCIATMRSWSTLMPGEQFPCVGCHESKTESPNPGQIALAGAPKPLEQTLGIEGKHFKYGEMIQPILDKNCITCHNADHELGLDLRGDLIWGADLSDADYKDSKRYWTRSYVALTEKAAGFGGSGTYISCLSIFSGTEQQAAYAFGSSKSPLMTKVVNSSHHDVKLTKQDKLIIACWIDLCCPHSGYYTDYMKTTDSTQYMKLLDKRLRWESIEDKNIDDLIKNGPVPNAINFGSDQDNFFGFNLIKNTGIQYFAKQQQIVLQRAAAGVFMVTDLGGRVLFRTKLSKLETSRPTTISLPANLSTGAYVVRFEGAGEKCEQMISVVK
jgi:hypothetical protein